MSSLGEDFATALRHILRRDGAKASAFLCDRTRCDHLLNHPLYLPISGGAKRGCFEDTKPTPKTRTRTQAPRTHTVTSRKEIDNGDGGKGRKGHVETIIVFRNHQRSHNERATQRQKERARELRQELVIRDLMTITIRGDSIILSRWMGKKNGLSGARCERMWLTP